MTQDLSNTCVNAYKSQIEAELKSPRFRNDSLLPNKKQLQHAVTHRTKAVKDKEKAVGKSLVVHAADVGAMARLTEAKKAVLDAEERDAVADAVVVRLEAVVRAAAGRLPAGPVPKFVDGMAQAVRLRRWRRRRSRSTRLWL